MQEENDKTSRKLSGDDNNDKDGHDDEDDNYSGNNDNNNNSNNHDDDDMPFIDDNPLPLDSDLDAIFEDPQEGHDDDPYLNSMSQNHDHQSRQDADASTHITNKAATKRRASFKAVEPIAGWQNEENDLPFRREMIREM
jgi:hypothetical protein